MKDIKSMIIGFLLATCMFLMMGAGSNDSKNGRYQAVVHLDEFQRAHHYLVDTQTGDWAKIYKESYQIEVEGKNGKKKKQWVTDRMWVNVYPEVGNIKAGRGYDGEIVETLLVKASLSPTLF